MKHVKENDLAHGEWEKWCKETINISSSMARKYINVFKEYENNDSYRLLTNDLGNNLDKLYFISTLEKDQLEQPHRIPSSGETKTVDEMTVKELREVKKALKKYYALTTSIHSLVKQQRPLLSRG